MEESKGKLPLPRRANRRDRQPEAEELGEWLIVWSWASQHGKQWEIRAHVAEAPAGWGSQADGNAGVGMETQDQGKRDGNKLRGERPWAGLATSCSRAGNLIYTDPVAHPGPSPQGKGKGCNGFGFDSPPGPETFTAQEQSAKSHCQPGAPVQSLPGTSNSPLAQGLKTLLHCQA